MRLEFKRLPEVKTADIIDLMNNPQVRKEMPLTKSNFNDGQFAGWGGVQPEAGEADLALVLHPRFWGTGKRIYDEIIKRAFEEMGLASVVIFFPPSRTRVRGLRRLGFVQDGEMMFGDERFIRYRLRNPAK
jgi:[ribosomal protein S5]-alanine N-acetyltransferase